MAVIVPDHKLVETVIREVSSAEIMPRFNSLGDGDRWEKRPGSIVTAADIAAEKFLATELCGLLPGAAVVGEEMASQDPNVVNRLDGDAPVWVLDPVDGTQNFARGAPEFAVMVGLVHRRNTLAGWIYRPTEDTIYSAEAGAGAFRDGNAIHVAESPSDASLLEGSLGGYLRRKTDLPRRFARVTATRCIGVDYCALAEGKIHFAHYRGVSVWDHVAGFLLHAEAGGYGFCLDGTGFRAGLPGEGGVLMTPDERTWQELRPMIADALKGRL